MTTLHYFLINKPYDYLSQFTKEEAHHQTLADLYDFPPDVYPVGRLDRDSEGLLLLTNDKQLHTRLLHPKWQHQRTYWVQVEGQPDAQALAQLEKGVHIRAKGQSWTTLPAKVNLLEKAPAIPERQPPIRERKNIPTTWLALSLTEGKNRQVRRMCAAVGYPVLRLIRYQIEGVTLDYLAGQEVKACQKEEIYRLLGISQK